MKKHLHGKRHTIARRSVVRGRFKRQARRIERKWGQMGRAVVLTALGLQEMSKEIRKVFDRISAATGVPLRFLVRARGSKFPTQDQN